jgi:CMP-N-acetylneuraminic acid synthetase|tara:strand:- start:45 stop:731 length:687 start_codon:yes stop_codon:yes gene_type:complete
MKKSDSIAIVVQARLNSQRVPQKMIRDFAGTTLFDVVLDKIIAAFPDSKDHIWASVYEDELINIAGNKGVNVFRRSYESANNDNSLQKIYEWHDKLPKHYKYVILVSGCNPLLKPETIGNFYNQFKNQEEENLFAVIEKKTYYWNKEGSLVTPWPSDQTIMNTKVVEPTYEAAHVLYASKLDLIRQDKFMGDFQAPGGIKLFTMPELEAFDIDYEWQFELGEKLYEKL